MIKIAICDDQEIAVEKIEKDILHYAERYFHEIKIDKFTSSKELAQMCKNKKYDVAFLDVEMEQMDGIDLGCEIKIYSPNTLLVYVSNYIDYSLRGYKVKAFSYILKSEIDKLFEKEMREIIAEVYSSKSSFSFTQGGDTFHILFLDIMYIMSDYRKIVIVTRSNQRYEFYSTMDEQESLFSQKNFLRVQKGYMVNLKYATNIKDYEIHLTTGEKISTIRKNFKMLKEKYAEIKGRM